MKPASISTFIHFLSKISDLLSAAAAYHPDKACNKENGMEWSFLSEEISKRINGFYSFYKDQEAGEET
jgi:hypothetical protein